MKGKIENKVFELNKNQINELIKLAQFKKGNVFYDLGSGSGKIVIQVAQTPVSKSIGVESCRKLYNMARKLLNQGIKNGEIKFFDKIDFWLSNIDNQDVDNDNDPVIDFSNATVVFYSMDETESVISDLKEWKIWNKVKLIKKDIPLIGYESESNKSDKDCWLFLTKPPYKRIKNKNKWAKTISDDFKTIDSVYDYYFKKLSKRFEKLYLNDKRMKDYSKRMGIKNAESSLLQLKISVHERFWY